MTMRFGWCLDGQHSQCCVFVARDYPDQTDLVCSCPCHETEEVTP